METNGGSRSRRCCRCLCQQNVLVPVIVTAILVFVYFPYKYNFYENKESSVNKFISDHQGFQKLENGSLMLISAYYDRRHSQPLVHILGFKRRYDRRSLYCKFIYSEYEMRCSAKPADPRLVDMRDRSRDYSEYFFTCILPPFGRRVPLGVTLTTKFRHCTLALKSGQVIFIHDPQSLGTEKPQGIGVCISAPGYDLTNLDHAQRIVETVVLNKAMGADYIEFHNESMTPFLIPTLQKYINEGTLGIVQWNSKTTAVHMYAQALAMNDCLYRNMYRFKYLIFTDIDELLAPSYVIQEISKSKWQNLFEFFEKNAAGTIGEFVFQTREYYEDDELLITDQRFGKYLSCGNISGTDMEDTIMPLSIMHRLRPSMPDPQNRYTRFAVRPSAIGSVSSSEVSYLFPGYKKVTPLRSQAAVRHFRSSGNPLNYFDLIEDSSLDEYIPVLIKALQETVDFPTKCVVKLHKVDSN